MLSVSITSNTPLHDQIVGQLRHLIAAGALVTGDTLPPVRQLAADLGINLNTVARAYRQLTDEGLLASTRGRGTCVVATVSTFPGAAAEAGRNLAAELDEALARAKIAGVSETDARAIADKHIAAMWRARSQPAAAQQENTP